MFDKLRTKAACAAHAAASTAGRGYDNVTGIFSRRPKGPSLEQMIEAELEKMRAAHPGLTPAAEAEFRKRTYGAAMVKALEGLGVNPAIAKSIDFSVLFQKREAA
jgi:hypothetical protein